VQLEPSAVRFGDAAHALQSQFRAGSGNTTGVVSGRVNLQQYAALGARGSGYRDRAGASGQGTEQHKQGVHQLPSVARVQVNQRQILLQSEKVLDEAALDRYSFIRDAWWQRRQNQVYDGNPPRPKEDE